MHSPKTTGKTETCPICGAIELAPLLFRDSVPVFQNCYYESVEQAIASTMGVLDLRVCASCQFMTNVAYDNSIINYDSSYNNDQSCSEAYQVHLLEIRDVVARYAIGARRVVEIGCGQGGFLNLLAEVTTSSVEMIGIDPAYRSGDAGDRRIRFVPEYCADITQYAPDLIIARHVIEHICSPRALFEESGISDLQAGTQLFIETPDLDWILHNRSYLDLFYEHCSVFTQQSIECLLSSYGYSVTRRGTAYQGQYLWCYAVKRDGDTKSALRNNVVHVDSQQVHDWYQRQLHSLRALQDSGPIMLWGAGAKGATYAQWLDPERLIIQGLVDIHPGKQDRFIAGSGHRIYRPTDLEEIKPSCVLVMNPVYTAEVQQDVKLHSPYTRCISIDRLAET